MATNYVEDFLKISQNGEETILLPKTKEHLITDSSGVSLSDKLTDLLNAIGDLTALPTTDKTSLMKAVTEIKNDVDEINNTKIFTDGTATGVKLYQDAEMLGGHLPSYFVPAETFDAHVSTFKSVTYAEDLSACVSLFEAVQVIYSDMAINMRHLVEFTYSDVSYMALIGKGTSFGFALVYGPSTIMRTPMYMSVTNNEWSKNDPEVVTVVPITNSYVSIGDKNASMKTLNGMNWLQITADVVSLPATTWVTIAKINSHKPCMEETGIFTSVSTGTVVAGGTYKIDTDGNISVYTGVAITLAIKIKINTKFF